MFGNILFRKISESVNFYFERHPPLLLLFLLRQTEQNRYDTIDDASTLMNG